VWVVDRFNNLTWARSLPLLCRTCADAQVLDRQETLLSMQDVVSPMELVRSDEIAQLMREVYVLVRKKETNDIVQMIGHRAKQDGEGEGAGKTSGAKQRREDYADKRAFSMLFQSSGPKERNLKKNNFDKPLKDTVAIVPEFNVTGVFSSLKDGGTTTTHRENMQQRVEQAMGEGDGIKSTIDRFLSSIRNTPAVRRAFWGSGGGGGKLDSAVWPYTGG
jgi:hypothetical protein